MYACVIFGEKLNGAIKKIDLTLLDIFTGSTENLLRIIKTFVFLLNKFIKVSIFTDCQDQIKSKLFRTILKPFRIGFR